MDIVLNDRSLDGQFTKESFFKYMQEEIIPSLDLLNENHCFIYKEYSTYDRKITLDSTFMDILKIQGDPIINKLRIYLVQLVNDEPFWNDSAKTIEGIEYSCDIKELPNCITEAYERDGIVFSFEHGRFRSTYLELWRNGVQCNVKNAYNQELLKRHLNEYGVIELWDKNSFYINGTGCKFEIRFNEGHHNCAHFHISKAEYSASLSIPDADIIAGELPSDIEKRIVSWALINMSKIIDLWNREHPENKVK